MIVLLTRDDLVDEAKNKPLKDVQLYEVNRTPYNLWIFHAANMIIFTDGDEFAVIKGPLNCKALDCTKIKTLINAEQDFRKLLNEYRSFE